MSRAVLLCSVFVLTLASFAARGQESATREPDLLLVDGIRLLERKQTAAFLKAYTLPDDYSALVKKFGSADALTAAFERENRHTTILAALHAAVKAQPTLSVDGTRATYPFDTVIRGERRLSLQKVAGKWYIRD
jgi:hypothetical protein